MLTYSPSSAVPATRLSNVCGVPVPAGCLASAQILSADGRVIPSSVRNVFSQHKNVIGLCNYELTWQPDGDSRWWLDTNTISALQASTIWLDDVFISPLSLQDLAELNRCREALSEQLEAIEPVVVYKGPIDAATIFDAPDGEWTCRLEEAISVLFPQAASGDLAIFESVYRSGELVYQGCIEYASRVFKQVRALARQLRYIGSLILTWFRSRKGLPDTLGLFLNERSWYLHHSAHPPAVSIKAVEGRFAAATRRVCSRPLPA